MEAENANDPATQLFLLLSLGPISVLVLICLLFLFQLLNFIQALPKFRGGMLY